MGTAGSTVSGLGNLPRGGEIRTGAGEQRGQKTTYYRVKGVHYITY